MTNTQLSEIDRQLFQLVEGINILDAIVPLNYKQQKQAFFGSHFKQSPEFVYNKKHMGLFQVKRDLFNLPIESLGDEVLVTLYTDVIESYVDKLDQIQTIGTPEFLYNSLRYYGEPSEKDLRNAKFIMHLPDEDVSEDSKIYNADDIAGVLQQFASGENLEHKIEFSESMIANALVSGTTIKINRSAQLNETELRALAHHEVGVHLVTTINARQQGLKILSMGCPMNTTTQEGLAILCEYLSGSLTLHRLKVLALRVLAVHSMINDRDFRQTFFYLREGYDVSDDLAFTICARVYRGGGFTKDYLYLQGLRQMLNAFEVDPDFNFLLAGKVSIEYLPIISRLIEKGYLKAPGIISALRSGARNRSIR